MLKKNAKNFIPSMLRCVDVLSRCVYVNTGIVLESSYLRSSENISRTKMSSDLGIRIISFLSSKQPTKPVTGRQRRTQKGEGGSCIPLPPLQSDHSWICWRTIWIWCTWTKCNVSLPDKCPLNSQQNKINVKLGKSMNHPVLIYSQIFKI